MKKIDTDGLKQELMSSPDLDEFLSENEEAFCSNSASDILVRLFNEKNISKAALARKSGISEVYLHQIFSGKRTPSRNRLLCLAFGLEAKLDDIQELLKLCGFASLYPKNRRDAIIIYGLTHNSELFEINDKLFVENEETLF